MPATGVSMRKATARQMRGSDLIKLLGHPRAKSEHQCRAAIIGLSLLRAWLGLAEQWQIGRPNYNQICQSAYNYCKSHGRLKREFQSSQESVKMVDASEGLVCTAAAPNLSAFWVGVTS